ncbi:alcohol dehydrogenase class-3-like [Macrobrachium nipponense]|uniref:alcohol dehydrogenase class-3-like n=1 Tax=Macrobrachium nipponense TaxID=159736 RepID=UPI0030C7ACA9
MASTKGQVIKCKAAVAWEKSQPMTVEEIEVAPPKAKEIRIKVIAAGLCHSDLSGWKGILSQTNFPCVLGHEASGVVESVGEGITSVKEGDHVLSSFLPHCHECHLCKSPNTNLCMKLIESVGSNGTLADGTTRLSCKGKTLHHFISCSTFAEYAVLPDGFFTKIRKDAPMDKICLLSCGVTTGYGGPVKVAKVTPGSTCAVFGLGAVGLGAVMGCKRQGAGRIFGVDINNDKKEVAKLFGVTDFVNPKEHQKPIDQVLLEKTRQVGCDYAFECIGNLGVIQSALNACRLGEGQCVVIGVPAAGTTIAVDPMQLLFSKVLTGCFFGGLEPSEVPALVDDYMKKKIMLDEFITHKLPIEDINKAFESLIQGKTLKTVLHF